MTRAEEGVRPDFGPDELAAEVPDIPVAGGSCSLFIDERRRQNFGDAVDRIREAGLSVFGGDGDLGRVDDAASGASQGFRDQQLADGSDDRPRCAIDAIVFHLRGAVVQNLFDVGPVVEFDCCVESGRGRVARADIVPVRTVGCIQGLTGSRRAIDERT
jgi:hypothetical protein